jgi:hypothetical protein
VFYLFSRKWFDGRIAFFATLVLSTSVLTIHVERHIPINSTFFLWLTISMFLFMDVVVSDSARLSHIYGAWFFLGLACLTKAPVRVLAWTKGSLIVGCVVIAICGVVLPLLAFYQLPEVKSHYAGFGILAVAGAAWIFDALRRRNYGAVVARMVILLLVVDLYIQGFIFPCL